MGKSGGSGSRVTGRELLSVLLDLRAAPRDGAQGSTYLTWRSAICDQMKWSVEEFEARMDKSGG